MYNNRRGAESSQGFDWNKMNKNKYLVTLWMDWYNYDECILQKFSIEYESSRLDEAMRKLKTITRQRVNEVLKEFEDFAVMGSPGERKGIPVDVNKNNKVVKKERIKIGDGSGHNFIYYDFEIIKVPVKTKIDENLFNLNNCEREVKNFFRDRYNQPQKNRPTEKRLIELEELAKGKLRLSSFSWFKK